MDFEKLARVRIRKGAGGGDPTGGGLCVMELVSWIDGDDRLTDQPHCACPALTAFAIALNDAAPDAIERNTLKPVALLLVGSRDSARRGARLSFLMTALARDLLAPQIEALGHAPHALAGPQLAKAAQRTAAALSNARRSEAWANLRAGLGRLAEAARTHGPIKEHALRDAVYCALTAPARAEQRLAMWRTARAILLDAIAIGAHGAIEAPAPVRERADA
jgi:hypothetical protein